ncbi:TPA: DUF2577 family protein, partial [Clostridioides difficile]
MNLLASLSVRPFVYFCPISSESSVPYSKEYISCSYLFVFIHLYIQTFKASFFIGKIKSKLPDLKIETNNIILEKEDILIDSWMIDRQLETFDTETNQEHQHEVKNPFIDNF